MSPLDTLTDLFRDDRLSALGVPHGVTTRALGNMKSPEARSRALEQAGLSDRAICVLKQVHGATVLEANLELSSAAPSRNMRSGAAREENDLLADGWIVRDPKVVACVYAADCLPIFVWEKEGKAVGVFHSGWRGLAAGMPKAAVRAFDAIGIKASRLAASVGPHIGACCYEVGEDVAAQFHPKAVRGSGRPKLDLGEEARLQFIESGLEVAAVSVSEACTRCLAEEFFSYRRDKMDQRMMAFIALGGRA